MKRTVLFASLLISTASSLFAYEERSIPNLTAPTVLKPIAIEVQVQHQFWGRINGKDWYSRLFGIGDGADASFGLRSIVWREAQVYAFYDNTQLINRSRNDFSAGLSYALSVPRIFLRMQADGEIFTYSSLLTYPEESESGYFVRGCFQNDPLLDRVTFLCNIGYNFHEKKSGLGVGVSIDITESFGIYGDYFPVWDKIALPYSAHGVQNPFSFGVKITTIGHQFFFFAGNATEIGFRRLMRGTSDNYLKLGFMIKRLFDFTKRHS